MLLTTVLVVVGVSGFVTLVILELMREVVILRKEVGALSTQLGASSRGASGK